MTTDQDSKMEDDPAYQFREEDEDVGFATPDDDDEDYDEGESNTNTPKKKLRKSSAGRKLVRWNETVDQQVLLSVDAVCARQGIAIPWDLVAKEIAPYMTGEAIKQHLVKVSKHRASKNLPVPEKVPKSDRRKAVTSTNKLQLTPNKLQSTPSKIQSTPTKSILKTPASDKKTPIKTVTPDKKATPKKKTPTTGERSINPLTGRKSTRPLPPASRAIQKREELASIKTENITPEKVSINKDALTEKKSTGRSNKRGRAPSAKELQDLEMESPTKKQKSYLRTQSPKNYAEPGEIEEDEAEDTPVVQRSTPATSWKESSQEDGASTPTNKYLKTESTSSSPALSNADIPGFRYLDPHPNYGTNAPFNTPAVPPQNDSTVHGAHQSDFSESPLSYDRARAFYTGHSHGHSTSGSMMGPNVAHPGANFGMSPTYVGSAMQTPNMQLHQNNYGFDGSLSGPMDPVRQSQLRMEVAKHGEPALRRMFNHQMQLQEPQMPVNPSVSHDKQYTKGQVILREGSESPERMQTESGMFDNGTDSIPILNATGRGTHSADPNYTYHSFTQYSPPVIAGPQTPEMQQIGDRSKLMFSGRADIRGIPRNNFNMAPMHNNNDANMLVGVNQDLQSAFGNNASMYTNMQPVLQQTINNAQAAHLAEQNRLQAMQSMAQQTPPGPAKEDRVEAANAFSPHGSFHNPTLSQDNNMDSEMANMSSRGSPMKKVRSASTNGLTMVNSFDSGYSFAENDQIDNSFNSFEYEQQIADEDEFIHNSYSSSSPSFD